MNIAAIILVLTGCTTLINTLVVGDVLFNYAEGSDNGPPLMLLYA